ncbi:SsgA family sporulation/cell division regulator [Streptomyces sp. DT195]|uniref:SsgA family sporulation/cell division regulator n=1 Tax=Streptomyces sp. DT195 TaxID=3393419 RepID=UPI003CEE2F05
MPASTTWSTGCSRVLLSWGTREPGGRGGVGVWPEGSGPEAWLYLTLSSPHGHARLGTPLQAVAEWLKRDIPPGALGGARVTKSPSTRSFRVCCTGSRDTPPVQKVPSCHHFTSSAAPRKFRGSGPRQRVSYGRCERPGHRDAGGRPRH